MAADSLWHCLKPSQPEGSAHSQEAPPWRRPHKFCGTRKGVWLGRETGKDGQKDPENISACISFLIQGHKCHPLCAPYSECSGPGPEDCHECLHVRLSYDGSVPSSWKVIHSCGMPWPLIFYRPCVEVCPEGGFLDMNTGVCEFCPPPCQKCKGPDVSSDCTSCLDGYLLVPDTGSCVLECPLGHYTGQCSSFIQCQLLVSV